MSTHHQRIEFRINKAKEYGLRERFESALAKFKTNNRGMHLYILPSAKKQLESLPAYEKIAISKRIGQLSANGKTPVDGFRNKVAQHHRTVLHANYYVDYLVEGADITVEGISIKRQLT